MKKAKLHLTAIVAIVLTLSGCSQKTVETGSGDIVKSAEKQEPVTVKADLSGAYVEVSHTFIDPIIKEKYPHITLEYMQSPPSLADKVATGDTPDIVFQNGSLRPAMDLNLQYGLNGLIKKYNFDIKKLDTDLLKSVQAFGRNGEIYALPSDRSVRVLLYNKDIFDKFGVPYPKEAMSWEEIIALARKLTLSEGGVNYHGLVLGDFGVMKSMLELPFFGKDGKAQLKTPGWEKIAQAWKSLYSIPGNYATTGDRDLFTKDRNTAMIITNSSFLLRNPIPDLNWDYVVSPTFDNHLIMDKLGAMLTIASSSKNKDAAFQVISLYFSDPVQIAIARTASLVPGSNVPEIIKQYGADVPSSAGKNLKADFSGNAATKVVEQYDYLAGPIVRAAFANIATDKQDINTALREAEEKVNQRVAEEKAK
ncbi:ABC transporter substrate-binding protein [Paenibacillus allorhizosphaerae]|uniref:Extracellular solute-binding protein n=1 Tax=Paenibacillus allorhizosphaerae TaxID=2849866 RepID=A0ABM8VAV0_9BACL|nr:extracellular solute-binding protein [Paenibacillus allorhizosphaerae]CAG7616030.1 hypothetical protein PAECIP111802_00239 [Paenibacillus allorhizosphaerae]